MSVDPADVRHARTLATLLDPARGQAEMAPPVPEAYADLLKLCQKNKVPLLSLDTGVAPLATFYASAPFQQALAEERLRWAALRAEYLPVRQAFEDAGIRDVLIKSVGLAPSLPYASDNLDVLVALADGMRARQVLLDSGYVELKNVEEPHKFLFRKFHLGRTVSAIHLHEFVGWGTGFMEDAQVLAQARLAPDDPALWIPAREDGLLITLAHAFYEDKQVKLGDLWKVIHVLQQGGVDWDAMYRQVSRRGWREGLDTCIWLWAALERALYGAHSFPNEVVQAAQRQAPAYCRTYLRSRLAEEATGKVHPPDGVPPRTFPFGVSFKFSKRHYYGKVWRDEALSWQAKGWDVLRHSLAGVKRRLPFKSQRPMLVTLSGIDGSGKTAYAELLAHALSECDIAARVVWSRGGSSRLTDGVIALVKPLLGRRTHLDVVSDTRQAKVQRKATWLRHPLLRWGWSALVVGDLLLHYWARIAWPLWRGRVVLCDRYVYDALVELAVLSGHESAARSCAARVLRALSPHPQLAYLLDVAPAEALARKPEELPVYLEQQAQTYHAFAATWGLRVVDTHCALAEVADALTQQVLHAYYRDWRTFINGLFLSNPNHATQRAQSPAGDGGRPCAS